MSREHKAPPTADAPSAAAASESLRAELDALRAASARFGVPGIDLGQVCIRLSDLDILPREIAERRFILPVLVREDRVFVATTTPSDKKVVDELEFVTGKRMLAYVALERPLVQVTSEAYDARARGERFYIAPRCPVDIQRKMGVPADQVRDPSAPSRAPLPTPVGTDPPAPSRAATPAPVDARPAAASGAEPALGAASGRRDASAPTAGVDAPPTLAAARGAHAPAAASAPRGEAAAPAEEPAPSEALPTSVPLEPLGPEASVGLSYNDFGKVGPELSMMSPIPRPPEATEPRKAAASVSGKTVLVVDDEPEIRKLLTVLLTSRGYRVLEASRGLEALRMVKGHMPDLLVLDAMLPEVHGFEIARRIRGSAKYGHIPIIMVSAVYKGWRFAADARASYGVDAYIEKPFRSSEVLGAIEQVFSRPRGEAPGAQPPAPDPSTVSSEAERWLNAGVAAYQAGDIDGAIEHLKRGVSIDPLAFRLHFHLGLLFGKKGMTYEAIEELERAVEQNPQHFGACKNLAVLYQKAGFLHKAIESWERALRAAPDDETRESIKRHLVSLL